MKRLIPALAFTILIGILSVTDANGQDTLRLLNGNILIVHIENITEYEISYSETYKGKKSFRSRELGTIFSYSKEKAPEIMVYKYNPEIGNLYKVPEMRNYIVGERHADQFYHSRFYNYLGLAGGAAIGYLISDNGSPALFVTPILYSAIVIIPGAKVKKNELNAELFSNNAYRDGYKRVAKGRKFFGSFTYSAAGMLAGLILFETLE